MISKAKLKQYEFKTLSDYFNYIIESEINGQYAQLKELIHALSKKQKKIFLEYLRLCEIDNIKFVGYLV